MKEHFRWLLAVIAVALAPATLWSQEPVTITGRVTDAMGKPLPNASVYVSSLNMGTVTRQDGNYTITVPASRVQANGQVQLSASMIGHKAGSATVTLNPGAKIVQNFELGMDVLELEGIVAIGQGTKTTRERLSSTVSSVKAEQIVQSREANIVSALAGKAANVQVTSSAGDPGAGAYIQIRGAASVVGGTQPLFVVDGTPIDNSSNAIEGSTAGTVVTNRAADINPADVQSVEILKGAAATAIYGSRAANGVVLITTKSGVAGNTRATYSMSYSNDEVTNTVPLQRRFGQGIDLTPLGGTGVVSKNGALTWGGELGSDIETFDHAREMFQTGHRLENNVTLSGGNDRTTYYLSMGRLGHRGVIKGNQEWGRNSARLKGSHKLLDDLKVSGNVAYVETAGDFIQQGSNISGIQLGALRTPPEFNNFPYLDPETGFHRSYRHKNPTNVTARRGYDNPFWVANEIRNEAGTGRAMGNVSLEYNPMPWLTFSYILGADYTSDERLTVFPKSSSDYPDGRMIRANFVNRIIDSNLMATASGNLGDNVSASVTVGQNLNQDEFRRNLVNGYNLIYGTEQGDFATTREADEFNVISRTDGYFATTEATFFDQLTVNATGRMDGSSTFGGGERFFYPGAGVSWTFTSLPAFQNIPALSFGKLRASWGVSGRQPPAFATVNSFTTATIGDGWLSGGLSTLYGGNEGVVSYFRIGNPEIRPEKKTEFETGLDLAFLDSRAALSVTYYNRLTQDALLSVDVAPSTGYQARYANVAEFENDGWEVTLDVTPVQQRNFSWQIGGQWSQNNSCVTELAGARDVYLAGFTGSTVSLVSPEVTGSCQPFGVFYGDDFVRFGRGITVGGQNIDEAHSGWKEGDLYVGEDGFPLMDPTYRVLGDPNADWLGSLRSSVTFFDKLRVSGLLDIKQGGDMWNGTRGALYFFGTHKFTEDYHGAGKDTVFAGHGPGAGKNVNLNWNSWTVGGLGSGFTGPASQFIEDASFVKLRDLSVTYTLDQPWMERFGFSTADVSLSGRNLYTWTKYTGIDPESNLTGQSTGRGLDYFNNPQTRSFVFNVNLHR